MNRLAELKITVLAENTARNAGLIGEHGLAVWLDTGSHRVLFDTGQGIALAHNAEQLGIDLSTADAIVLSHGHYDHVGGLEAVLAAAPRASLHLHPDAVQAKFSGSQPGPTAHRVSIPFVEDGEFERDGREVIRSRTADEIVPGVWATGEIPRLTDFEDTGGPFFLDRAMERPDPLADDQALFMQTGEGLVVVFGCAHSGVVNTLLRIEELTGNGVPIRLLIGGLHLLRASPRRMDETIRALSSRRPEQMVFCHCTGPEAVCRLGREFPNRCLHGHAGLTLGIP